MCVLRSASSSTIPTFELLSSKVGKSSAWISESTSLAEMWRGNWLGLRTQCSTETKKDDIEKVNEVKCCLMRCWKAAGNPLPDFLEAEAWPLGMEEDGAKVAGPSNSFVLFECSSTKAVNWILKAVSFFSRKFSPYTNGCQQPVAFTGTPTLQNLRHTSWGCLFTCRGRSYLRK